MCRFTVASHLSSLLAKEREGRRERWHSCLYLSTGHTCDYMLSCSLTLQLNHTHTLCLFSFSLQQTHTCTKAHSCSCSQRHANSYTYTCTVWSISVSRFFFQIHTHMHTQTLKISYQDTLVGPIASFKHFIKSSHSAVKGV